MPDKVCGVRLLGTGLAWKGDGVAYELDTCGPLGHSEVRLAGKVVQVPYEAGHDLRQAGVGVGTRGGDDSVGEGGIVPRRSLAWLAVLCGTHLVVSDGVEQCEVWGYCRSSVLRRCCVSAALADGPGSDDSVCVREGGCREEARRLGRIIKSSIDKRGDQKSCVDLGLTRSRIRNL